MKKQLLDITGMSCSACSSRIEKVVNRMQGVEQMSVNLLKNNAHVTFDESVVDEKEIIARIEKLGFGASVHAAGAGYGGAGDGGDASASYRLADFCRSCFLSAHGAHVGLAAAKLYSGAGKRAD